MAQTQRVYVASSIFNFLKHVKAAMAPFLESVALQPLDIDKDGELTEDSKKHIPDIEILFADPTVIPAVVSYPQSKIRWVQSTFAGVEVVVKALQNMQKIPQFVLTRQSAGFGQFMSEYVLGHIIARERNFLKTYNLQREAKFDQLSVKNYRGLDELSLGVLGLGVIGSDVAQHCKEMKMTVWGAMSDDRFNATNGFHQHVHHCRPLSQLSDVLSQCDYLVSVLPSTPATRGVLSGDVLEACQHKKTVFINIGRGDVIDDNSLINAVRSGWLGGAILDVFNEEPLPSNSPLWTLPGVTITPHVSGITSGMKASLAFVENLQRYLKGEPLNNMVDISRGY